MAAKYIMSYISKVSGGGPKVQVSLLSARSVFPKLGFANLLSFVRKFREFDEKLIIH